MSHIDIVDMTNESPFLPLSDLDLAKTNFKVKVRIICTWRRLMNNDKSRTLSIEFICIDEQGNKVGGSCLSNFLYKFERFILPEAVLVINKSILGDNNGKWTVTPHKYKLGFNNETEVVTDSNWNGSNYAFNFTSFDDIIKCKPSQTTSFDIIGVLKNCPPIKSKKNAKGEVTNSVCVLLRDLTEKKVWFTLFEQYAFKLTEYVKAHPHEDHYVVIIQHAKFDIFKGRYSVSTGYDSSNLFINCDELKETATFLHKFLELNTCESSSSFSRGSSSVVYNLEDDFLNNTDYHPIAEVYSLQKPKPVILVATIKVVYNKWYYMACNHCNCLVQSKFETVKTVDGDKEVSDERIVYSCNTDTCKNEKKVIHAFPRYKIPLSVQDSTGNLDLTLFEGEAKKIIGKTALEVFDSFSPPKENPFKLPPEIESFIETKYAFKIFVSEKHISKIYKTYTINTLTSDKNIIKAFEDKYINHQVASLQENANDDNITPQSVNMTLKTVNNPGDSNSLKRNLEQVYDVDDFPDTSLTKSKKSSDNKPSNSGYKSDEDLTSKLLIPKIEK